MSNNTVTIHISEIDAYLASRLVDGGETTFGLHINKAGDSVTLSVWESDTEQAIGIGSVDFELSSCECSSLEQADLEEYLKKPVITSSAYELFDFLLGRFSCFDCLVEFTGNAWKIRILDPG